MTAIRLKIPATSANLGPGFDALGLALGLYLTIEARANAAGPDFRVEASGRDAALVRAIDGNLLIETYRSLAPNAPALELVIANEIPLGMGLGSSAAALVAGVLLANHFGGLQMDEQETLAEACRREGHPDNVAACLLGGFTVSAMDQGRVSAASFPADRVPWKVFVALPGSGLATAKARALLPSSYSRADAVANVQASALLVSAFALGRADLLGRAMQDRLHQPYRAEVCPLLPRLLPLAGAGGVLGVALSGAGPSVLLLADAAVELPAVKSRVLEAVGGDECEVLEVSVSRGAVLGTL